MTGLLLLSSAILASILGGWLATAGRHRKETETESDLRLLRWALAAAVVGTGCGAASVILDFGWAYTETAGMLTAAHWLTWLTFGCLAVVVTLGLILARRRP
jgi:hypothetical protein